MSAALMYCTNQFNTALHPMHHHKAIHAAFHAVALEINQLDERMQLHLYSAATQYLQSFIQDPNDLINPLEVFVLRCNSLVEGQNDMIKKIGLALAVILIALSVVITGAALGMGIGMLLGVWHTPLLFLTSLYAAETAALGVAASSMVAGLGAGLLAQCLFFKEPKIKRALAQCVEVIKHSQLSTTSIPQGGEECGQEEGSGAALQTEESHPVSTLPH